jgi:hypothetical protein
MMARPRPDSGSSTIARSLVSRLDLAIRLRRMLGDAGAVDGDPARCRRSLGTGRTDGGILIPLCGRLIVAGSKPLPLSTTSSRQRVLLT